MKTPKDVKPEPMAMLAVRVPLELLAALEAEAKKRDVTPSAIVRGLVADFTGWRP